MKCMEFRLASPLAMSWHQCGGNPCAAPTLRSTYMKEVTSNDAP